MKKEEDVEECLVLITIHKRKEKEERREEKEVSC